MFIKRPFLLFLMGPIFLLLSSTFVQAEIRTYSFPSSPGATANGDEWSSAYDAAKAFDSNNSTAYCSKAGNTYPHVLAYDCGSARSVSSISLNQGWHPATSVQVLGSNDNASWTDLGTFSTSAGLNTLSLSSAQSFRYWAIRALAGNSTYWCVYEIGLGGTSRTASGTVTSYSLCLNNMSGRHSTGGFDFYVYFSTYDGIANAFPQGLGYNESGELSPTTLGGTQYVSDYAIIRYRDNYYYNRGYLILNIPNTDSDANGFPDLLQVDKAVNSTIGFSLNEYETSNGGYTYSSYGTFTGNLTLTRSAGNYQGTASGTINNSTFSGSFKAEGGFGNAVYDLSARSIRFEGTSFGLGTTGSGTSTFTRISDNRVDVAAFYFYTSDGYRRTVYGFSLYRSGKYYRGNVALADGDPGTSYVDYKDCFIEIYDSNDSDFDGIPDLSDR